VLFKLNLVIRRIPVIYEVCVHIFVHICFNDPHHSRYITLDYSASLIATCFTEGCAMLHCLYFSATMYISEPIPVAARSKACVCGRSLAGIVGSNPAGDMEICALWVVHVVR